MSFSAEDHALMARALALAERGRATATPNPSVGCVIARGGRILGEGWHARAGEPHAEAMALAACRGGDEGATAYLTLEPLAGWSKFRCKGTISGCHTLIPIKSLISAPISLIQGYLYETVFARICFNNPFPCCACTKKIVRKGIRYHHQSAAGRRYRFIAGEKRCH